MYNFVKISNNKTKNKKNNFFFNKKKFIIFSAIGSFKPIKNVDCMNNNVPMWLKHCPYEYNDSRNHFLSSWLSIQKSYEIVLHFKKKQCVRQTNIENVANFRNDNNQTGQVDR